MSAVARSRPYSPAHTRMRHRALAIAACLAVAVGAPAAYFAPLCAQYAEGPSAEAAIADANRRNGRELSYSLESERTEPDGSVVYRLVSDSEPPVHYEQRYRFRWFPELSISSGMPIPSIDMPGPCYEMVNEEEFMEAFVEWSREQTHREGRDWLSLHPQKRREMEAAEAEGASVEEGPARETAGRVASKYAARGYDVHVTGHSLGGYLAQVGAAELLGTPWSGRLWAVEYFNGMGLDYAPWADSSPAYTSERAALGGFSERTGALVGHRIVGDPVSLLGIHSGAVRSYWAAAECVGNHEGIDASHPLNEAPVSALALLASSTEPLDAMRAYGLPSKLWMYMWSVHETDSFFYRIG